ncbi:MAG: ATP-binding cassette domain-containing protein [Anaerolineae bacterium]|nr:ATP-binding cassette domain-containing protein [Anaerolineae bacterium]
MLIGTDPLVVVQDLYYAYPPLVPGDASVEALRGVSFSVVRGEMLAILGPSGAGKSTLCLALCAVVPHSTGGVFGGQVLVCHQDTRQSTPAQLSTRVGVVFQDPESQLFATVVEDEVAFGLESQGMPREEMVARVDWALGLVGMRDHRLRNPALLSGGQKQRVAIAAAIATKPDLLILDEPTASLDPVGSQEVVQALSDLLTETDCAVVMATQDAELAARFAHRVLLLDQGKITYDGPASEVLSSPDLLAAHALYPPPLAELAAYLSKHGFEADFLDLESAEARLRSGLLQENSCLGS